MSAYKIKKMGNDILDRIEESMSLTMICGYTKSGALAFKLIGIVPARITWANGEQEDMELLGQVTVKPFSAGKELLGKRVLRKEFIRELDNADDVAILEAVEQGIRMVIDRKTFKSRGGEEMPFVKLELL